MHVVNLQMIKLLYSPDKTLYSEILLPAKFLKFYLCEMPAFYTCAIILIVLIIVFIVYPNITFTITYSNKMHISNNL